MSIHKDHRQRLKKRFMDEGLDHFEELHVLELLLFYAIPQGDVNPLAHRLLEHFGSLRQVLLAPPEQLQQVPGVGAHTTVLLALIKGVAQKYLIEQPKVRRVLRTKEECGKYLLDHFVGRWDETVMLLCLDAKRVPLCCRIVSKGSVNTAEVSVRKVVEVALSVNATTVMLAHNHPSGIAVPSMEDIITTRRVATALDAIGITLEDHIVVADRDYVSLRDSKYYDPEQCRLMV